MIKHKYIRMPFRIVYKMMTFGVPLQFFFEMYLELCVNIWVAIFVGLNYNNYAQMFSSVLAIVIFAVTTVSPIYSYAKIMDSFDKFTE